MQERKFYPMLTQTIKSALCLADPSELWYYIDLLITYPEISSYNTASRDAFNKPKTPIAEIILEELARQYTRWNKGGENA